MKAYTYELSDVFANERRYLVPTYQRDYEWTATGQWELLFEDLLATADRLADARTYADVAGTDPGKAAEEVAPHFLGAVVIEPVRSAPDEMKSFAVIDGQQRLTTLALLLRALADVCSELSSTRASRMRRLLFNPIDDPQHTPPEHRFKLWPRRKDRDIWESVMADDPSAAPSGHLYTQARRFFASRIRTAVAPVETDEAAITGTGSDSSPAGDGVADVARDAAVPRDLDTIADAAAGLFKLVVIDLDPNDDAQVIFEVLNGRQTPLSPADLVKNLLFLRAELADEAALEAMHDRWWAPLETDWWKTVVGRGHAARGRREYLLAGWLSAQLGEEANVGHLYGDIRRYLAQGSRKVEDVLAEIAAYGHAYKRLVGEADGVDARCAVAYRRLNDLSITTAQPLLLWLECCTEDQLGPLAKETAVLAVESWAIRRLFTGRQTRGYGRVLVGAVGSARKVSDAGGSGLAVSDAIIDHLSASTLIWPSDEDVRAAFLTSPFYGYHGQPRLRMLLGALDAAMAADDSHTEPATIDYDSLTIEHVLPQSWSENWSTAEIRPDTPKGIERDRALQRIGNLTLITGTLNPAVSNGAWSTKRTKLAEHSGLALNRQLCKHETWTETEIEERAKHLAAVAAKVWPSPEHLRSAATH